MELEEVSLMALGLVTLVVMIVLIVVVGFHLIWRERSA